MPRKRVTLFPMAKREIVEGSTTSATFTMATEIPLQIAPATPDAHAVDARGIRMLLNTNGRVTNNLASIRVSCFLEQQDALDNWVAMTRSTTTVMFTATGFAEILIYPNAFGTTNIPIRRSFTLPGRLRAVAKLGGSITVTPSMTFGLEAELLP